LVKTALLVFVVTVLWHQFNQSSKQLISHQCF